MKNADYPLYRPYRINNLKELIEYGAKEFNQKDAFVYRVKEGIQRVSYAGFKSDIEAFGTALYELGLKGSHIAVLGENSYEWVLSAFSIMNGSSVMVPVDKELPVKDIANILSVSECRAFIYSSAYADIIDEVKSLAPCVEFFIEMNLQTDENSILSFPGLLEKGRRNVSAGVSAFASNRVNNDALAVILFTSGTTGKSKGVMLSHANLAIDTFGVIQLVKYGDRSVMALPLHHTYAFTACVLMMLLSGSSIFITGSLKNFYTDLRYHKPTDFFLVPMIVESVYKKIWEDARKNGTDRLLKRNIRICNAFAKIGINLRRILLKPVLEIFGGELNFISCGGALINPKFYKGFRDLGIGLMNGYGITECSPVVSLDRNHHHRDGSIGRPLQVLEVKIGNPNENGDGEILVKGPTVMKGYYKNPQATAAAFDGEWFKTGDIGHFDTDGFLYITGRIKNLIVLSNGKNVYPEELELLVANLPYVKETVVYEHKDESGPAIAVQAFFDADYLKAHPAEPMEERFNADIENINRELPAYKRISVVKIRNTEFEKTASKKIKRNVTGG